MTRTIKASEVKPGMTIRAEYLGVTHELTVSYVESARGLGGAEVRTGLGGSVYLSGRKPVTVLAEPQPEEPDRIEEWDTWEDVPKGVAVTTPGLFCHYRKNQGVVEVSYPKENPDWMKCGIRYMSHRYAPWTRVTNA